MDEYSLACKLKIKGAKRDAERLEYRKGERDIHVEILFPYSTKLHMYSVIINLIYQLEVFD